MSKLRISLLGIMLVSLSSIISCSGVVVPVTTSNQGSISSNNGNSKKVVTFNLNPVVQEYDTGSSSDSLSEKYTLPIFLSPSEVKQLFCNIPVSNMDEFKKTITRDLEAGFEVLKNQLELQEKMTFDELKKNLEIKLQKRLVEIEQKYENKINQLKRKRMNITGKPEYIGVLCSIGVLLLGKESLGNKFTILGLLGLGSSCMSFLNKIAYHDFLVQESERIEKQLQQLEKSEEEIFTHFDTEFTRLKAKLENSK